MFSPTKITSEHLTVSGPGRQNVTLACQLLSASVGNELKNAGDPESNAVGDFCSMMNDWFDVFDSSWNRKKRDPRPLKAPYGKYLEIQRKVLEDTKEFMGNLRTINKKGEAKSSLHPFQKAIILNCNSLQGIYDDLNKDFGILYVETKNLNSDALENVFSQLKIKGMNDLPSPLEFLHREKLFFLGKNTSSLKQHKNTIERVESSLNTNFSCLIGKNMQALMKTLAENNDVDDFQDSEVETTDDDVRPIEPYELVLKLEDDGDENDCQKFKILCGIVAAKLAKRFPFVQRNLNEKPLSDSHVIIANKGIVPSDEFLEMCAELEKFFNQYHGTAFKGREKPVSSLIEHIGKQISVGSLKTIDQCFEKNPPTEF